MSARVTFKSGKSKVTDGPFIEAKEVIGGFWIIQVKSRIPGADDVMVEVRRLFDISDFTGDVQEKIAEFEQADASKLGRQ